MNKTVLPLTILATFVVFFLQALPAQAQATRTWVSGVGDDANPCSRTAPCKTFAGAISKTAAGGEISVLDPGGFGAVTITKSITINGDGTLAGVLTTGQGIIVNAGVNDRVILRNLSIVGAGGSATNGINWLGGAQLTVDRCSIYGFTTTGINVAKSTDGELYVRDTYITNTSAGIKMTTTSGAVTASVDNVRIDNMTGNGVEGINSVVSNINNSSIFSNAGSAVITSGASTITVTNSQLYLNITALNAAASGSTIRTSNNNIFHNATAFTIAAGATIATGNNNKTGGNGGATVPNGTIGNQ